MKPPPSHGNRAADLSAQALEMMVCPKSRTPLVPDNDRLVNTDPDTRLAYRIQDGIPVMLMDEATALPVEEWTRVMQAHGRNAQGAAVNAPPSAE